MPFCACLSLVSEFSTNLQIWSLISFLCRGVPPNFYFLTIMKQNFLFKVKPSSGWQHCTVHQPLHQWDTMRTVLSSRKKKKKSFFLIGLLEEKRVRAEIHHADCWPCVCGATWWWCSVGFVRVLVVLDFVEVSWISGGKPSHSREQFISSVSHQPHSPQRDDKWAGPHAWLWQALWHGVKLMRGADSGEAE